MKKYLLGTTALATAGLVAGLASDATAGERIKVGIGGYHQQWGVYANQDIDDDDTPGGERNRFKTVPVDQKHNSEICFIGETTLDNGITFGLNVQLEANTESDQIDESFLFVQSDSMGRLILGDENNAGYLLHVTAPNGGISVDSGDMINDSFWENVSGGDYFDTTLGTTNLRFNDNDSGKFTYISPRFAGFQLGASFIPILEPGGGDDNSSVYKSELAGEREDDDLYNGVAVGGNFKEDFNGFGVQLSAGWMGASSSAQNDLSAANVGAQFSYAGFSLGGAYVKAFGGTKSVDGDGNELEQFDGIGWTVGGAYEIGPYKVGITYQRGENDGFEGGGGDFRLDQGNISGTYQFGPGIRLVGGFFAFDLDTQGDSDGTVGFDNDGWGFASGIKLGF